MRRRGLVWLGALALLLTGCGSGSSSEGPAGVGGALGERIQAGTSGVDRAPYACPDPLNVTLPPPGADTLPMGATAARICVTSGRPGWRAPPDDLRTGLAHLVRVVNAQPLHGADPGTGCAQFGSSAWALVLRYPDGTRTVTGDNAGCWDLRVGATQREGVRHVYEAYLRALARQRSRSDPPDVIRRAPRCPQHAVPVSEQLQDPVADPTDTHGAVLCVLTAHHGRTIAMPRSAQVALHHDFAAAAGRPTDVEPPRDCRSLAPAAEVMVRGTDAWGSRFSVLFDCDVYRLLPPAAHLYEFVRLLPATERMLRHLLAS
jgi:hypothetical protein